MRSPIRSCAVTAAVLALLLGCSAAGDTTAESCADAPSAAGGIGDESLDLGGAADADRQFITTGSVSMAVEDPSEAAAQTARLVESVGGHVQQLQVRGDGGVIPGDEGDSSASLVVRVPSTEVAPTLDRLPSSARWWRRRSAAPRSPRRCATSRLASARWRSRSGGWRSCSAGPGPPRTSSRPNRSSPIGRPTSRCCSLGRRPWPSRWPWPPWRCSCGRRVRRLSGPGPASPSASSPGGRRCWRP